MPPAQCFTGPFAARTSRMVLIILSLSSSFALADDPLKLSWSKNYLKISGDQVPGREIEILYLEAYCRDGAHESDWSQHTVVGHSTRLLEQTANGRRIRLRCTLKDGVIVDHLITSTHDEVDFRLTAHNPTSTRSQAAWAQPCIRVGDFTGLGDPARRASYDYLKRSFVFINGKLTRMPTPIWATRARYIPGQVWRAPNVRPADVNPRPLNPQIPSNGLIGCFSHNEKMILATAWTPYHELFQGVITCLHSDFRLGGLKPDERIEIRGKLYLVTADIDSLIRRYESDFPELAKLHSANR